MSSRPPSSKSTVTDVLLGAVLVAGGAVLLIGTYLRVMPSPAGLGAFALIAGLLGLAAALVGQTSAGFWAELVPSALLTVLGVVVLRYPNSPVAGLVAAAAALTLVNGIVRLVSITEFPGLRGILLVCGAASLVIGVVLLMEAVKPSVALLGAVIGLELVVDGLAALMIGRHERPKALSR